METSVGFNGLTLHPRELCLQVKIDPSTVEDDAKVGGIGMQTPDPTQGACLTSRGEVLPVYWTQARACRESPGHGFQKASGKIPTPHFDKPALRIPDISLHQNQKSYCRICPFPPVNLFLHLSRPSTPFLPAPPAHLRITTSTQEHECAHTVACPAENPHDQTLTALMNKTLHVIA